MIFKLKYRVFNLIYNSKQRGQIDYIEGMGSNVQPQCNKVSTPVITATTEYTDDFQSRLIA